MAHEWLNAIRHAPPVVELAEALAPGARLMAEGSWGSSTSLLAGALAERTGRCVLLIVAHLDDADEAAEDLSLYEGIEVVTFPALEVLPGESNVSLELLADRLGVVTRLLTGDQPRVLVASVQALMQAVPMPEAIEGMVLDLHAGDEIGQQRLTEWLTDAGYERVDVIDQPGDFAVRGGLVDVFPPGNLPPVRIDFFGDQIESLSEIDLDSMGSNRRLRHVKLIGASAERITKEDRTTSLWSMLGGDTIVVQQESLEVAEQARGYYERLTEGGVYSPQAVQKALASFAQVEVSQYAAPGMADRRIGMPVSPMINFDREAAKAVAELGELATGAGGGDARRVVVLCQRDAERDRLIELIREHAPQAADRIAIDIGYLYRGFLWDAADADDAAPLALVPHHELFHRYQTRRRVRRIAAGRSVEGFYDLEVDDYVVHAHHGIARFRGMRMMKKDDEAVGEEYLTLEFADRALLHVPASQIHLVQKYVGGFSGRPNLSKLGGTRWKKQKEQAAEGAKQLAKELLQVQAARSALPGIAYPPDTPWMKQFEAEFPYQETDDQLAAIAEIKKDMQQPRPMDRLICGDVGYGKTELAIRAAFKAIEAGRQVAVLCPTTVLCEQHERTFRERMADYPVAIESLSRFKTAGQTRQVLEHLRDGSIDLVIGTHRLLSEDVRFADLGLVIIDEEQRFGVEHKNRLMRFRVTVDVLTLSATPIPRTLHMAMLGLRDISSLSTAPADRRAIVTEVVPWESQRIRRAILRELNRGGQCYFVHNRVQSIHQVAIELAALVPEARFIVGHGQMPGRELEDVMLKFVRHEADVLVCTTIIESGLDIPTANTMFIADCDRFGLAEMHQLRGRVGRYKHRAYCYLLLPKDRALTEVASRRLRAIEEYSMLGAGFKIAMRDLEIRGVGNILGPEQSGHIAAVGYEMYCHLLEEATEQLRSHAARRKHVEPLLDLKLAGHLPRTYIPSDKHRMAAYRRISRAHHFDDLRQVEKDLTDAYGPPPKPARILIDLAEIRIALAELEVESLTRHEGDLILTTFDPRRLSPLLAEAPGSVRLVDTPTKEKPAAIYFRPPPNYLEPDTLPAVLRKLLVRPLDQPSAPAVAAAN